MPRGDGTGPNGQGPRTGKGMGYCNGYSRAGFQSDLGERGGMGFRRGFGRGRFSGTGRRFTTSTHEEGFPGSGNELSPQIVDRIEAMQRQIESLHERIANLTEIVGKGRELVPTSTDIPEKK